MSEFITLASIGLMQLAGAMSPGPSFLLTAQTAAAASRRAGVMVALGLSLGAALWAIAALFGLNLLFQNLPLAYAAVEAVGGVFLLWIGVRIFRAAARPMALTATGGGSQQFFLRGFLLQMSNPKAALFFSSIFIAMLPREAPLWMLLALVAIVFCNDMGWYSLVSLFFASGSIRERYLAARTWLDRVVGAGLAFLGIRLLWQVLASQF